MRLTAGGCPINEHRVSSVHANSDVLTYLLRPSLKKCHYIQTLKNPALLGTYSALTIAEPVDYSLLRRRGTPPIAPGSTQGEMRPQPISPRQNPGSTPYYGCQEARSIGRASCLQGPFIHDNAQQQEAGHFTTWPCRRDDVDRAIVVARRTGACTIGAARRQLCLRCFDCAAVIAAPPPNQFSRPATLVSDRDNAVRGISDSRPGHTAVVRLGAEGGHYVAAARCDDYNRDATDARADCGDACRIVHLCSDMGGAGR